MYVRWLGLHPSREQGAGWPNLTKQSSCALVKIYAHDSMAAVVVLLIRIHLNAPGPNILQQYQHQR